VEEVLDEVQHIWSSDGRRVERFVSIGTGKPVLEPFGQNLKAVAEALVRISTDTERAAERFEKTAVRAYGFSGLYFRFNSHGLEKVGLENYSSLGRIVAATNNYLNENDTRKKLDAFAANIPCT
jgi:hypothetical protein